MIEPVERLWKKPSGIPMMWPKIRSRRSRMTAWPMYFIR
jgi:hypothetical protein